MTHPSRKWHFLTGFLILFFVLTGFSFLDDYGMGWDEVTRWNSGDIKVDYYLSLLDGTSAEFNKQMSGDRYPGLFDLTLASLHRLTGGDRMWMGHALSLCFAAVGLIATSWLANTVFGPRVAFISTLLLVVFPNFYGHAMINPKDIPFMAMYTLGLAAVLHVSGMAWETGKITPVQSLLAGLTIGLAAACRVPGIVLLGMAGAAWGFALLWGARKQNHPASPPRMLANITSSMAVCGVVAFLVLFVFFPRLHFQLFNGIAKVSSSLHTSASSIPLLYNGQVMDAGDGPATYAMGFFMLSTPVWMLILTVAGISFAVIRLSRSISLEPGRFLQLLLLLLFAAFPWLYVAVAHPALHNGIRHMLWAIPPLMILAGFGYEAVHRLIRSKFPGIHWLPPITISLCLIAQIFQLYRSHPYQYVYFNFLAGERSSVINRYEGEYWFTSTRHLMEVLPCVAEWNGDPKNPVKVRISGPLNAAYPFIPEGFILVDSFEEAEYYVSNTTFRMDLMAEGEVVYQIDSAGIPIGVIKQLSK
jgi:hypothetical protein